MTLQEFTRDIVPIIQVTIGLLGLVSLVLVVRQIRQTNRWQRLNYLNNFVDSSRNIELERKIWNSAKLLSIDLNKPLTEEDTTKIWNSDNDETFYSIKSYLSDLEVLCLGIRVGAADTDLAYALHSNRIIMAYRLMKSFIERIRTSQGNEDIFIELEKTALEYERKSQELAGERKKLLDEAKRKIETLKRQVEE